MRVCLLCLTALLAGCVQPSGGVDWRSWTYAQIELDQMRTDRAPEDAPYTDAQLADHFQRIAFGFEADPFGTGKNQGSEHAPVLNRWTTPIRFSVASYGDRQERFTDGLNTFAERLEGLTGHPVSAVDEDATEDEDAANVLFFYGPDEFVEFWSNPGNIARLHEEEVSPGIEWVAQTMREWRVAPSPCAGSMLVQSDPAEPDLGVIRFAIIMVRDEVPGLLMTSCIEEELSQTMGLANDDLSVRPSIYNDDQEFAYMTDHDAQLLRILYDPRLKPGMTSDVAMPIVRQIIAERDHAS